MEGGSSSTAATSQHGDVRWRSASRRRARHAVSTQCGARSVPIHRQRAMLPRRYLCPPRLGCSLELHHSMVRFIARQRWRIHLLHLPAGAGTRPPAAALLSGGRKSTFFLRQLGGINSNSYRQFMTMKRPMQGSGNCIYPAAYHFFEQRRLAAGKPKSKLRLESEIAFPQGHSLQPNWGRCIVPYGTIPVEDRLGRITVVPKYPKPRPLSMKQLEKLLADDT